MVIHKHLSKMLCRTQILMESKANKYSFVKVLARGKFRVFMNSLHIQCTVEYLFLLDPIYIIIFFPQMSADYHSLVLDHI